MIHFWVPAAAAAPEEVLAWDPDLEPTRYASGVGHNLLELGVRLARSGVEVSLGEEVPPGTALVVVFAKSIHQKSVPERVRLRSVLDAGRNAGGRFAVVRSDAPASWTFPVRPVVEFMATRQAVQRSWQQWLPPLTQRGLVPRRRERYGQIRCLAFKGNHGTVPPVLRSAEWTDALAARGIEWRLDAPELKDRSDQSWHDFATVDAVLCTRVARSSDIVERKPATRLINAWVAGCVPLVDPEVSYLELGTDGSDAFFVDTPLDGLDVLDRLNGNRDLLRGVELRIGERASEYAATTTFQRWRDALLAAAEPTGEAGRRRVRSVRLVRARATVAAADRFDPQLSWLGRAVAPARRRAGRVKRALLRLKPS